MSVMVFPCEIASRPPCSMIIMPRLSISDTILSRVTQTPLMKPIRVAMATPRIMPIPTGNPRRWIESAPRADEIPVIAAIERSISPTSRTSDWARPRRPSTVACTRTFCRFEVEKKKGFMIPKIATSPASQIHTTCESAPCTQLLALRRGACDDVTGADSAARAWVRTVMTRRLSTGSGRKLRKSRQS